MGRVQILGSDIQTNPNSIGHNREDPLTGPSQWPNNMQFQSHSKIPIGNNFQRI